jgi:hypothetical protein
VVRVIPSKLPPQAESASADGSEPPRGGDADEVARCRPGRFIVHPDGIDAGLAVEGRRLKAGANELPI